MSARVSGASSSNDGKKAVFSAHISRRVRACDECRRHKVGCSLKGPHDEGVPCERCARMGLTCNLTKSLQSILEERNVDEEWKKSVEKRLEFILRRLETTEEGPSKRKRTSRQDPSSLGMLADIASDGVGSSWNELSNETASAPGLYISRISAQQHEASASPVSGSSFATSHDRSSRPKETEPDGKRGRMDILERGLVTAEQAQTLVKIYLQHLDPHVYSLVTLAHTSTPMQRKWHSEECVQRALESIRQSPLLLLVICTVGALHNASLPQLYSTLHDEFVRASAQQSVVREQSLDDVRALLIASWWLRDVSWIFSGSAVRIATERAMQEAYKRCSDMTAGKQACRSKALDGKGPSVCAPGEAVFSLRNREPNSQAEREAYEAARLYYLVYVADHQAAIPFSRPPMTRQHAAVRNVRAWLAGCRLAEAEDARLAAQVELWVIAHDVVDDFGVDVQQPLTRRQVMEQVPRFLALVDKWQERWQYAATTTGNQEEVSFQAEMMRLFVTAHIFRSPRGVDPLTITVDDEEMAEWALDEVEQRMSFAQKSMPTLPRTHTDDQRRFRFDLGCQAVQTANRLIKQAVKIEGKANGKEGMYGLPIYPFAMVLFACLFLNKLSRRQAQTQETLPGCSPLRTIKKIDQVASYLRSHVVPRCTSEHISATVLPGLMALLDVERDRTKATATTEEIVDPDSDEQSTSPAPAHATRQTLDDLMVFQPEVTFHEDESMLQLSGTGTSPSFNFDLKSLDQLSGERYLSGVTNDALFWGFSEPVL